MHDDFADNRGRDDDQMAESPEGGLSRRGVLVAGAAVAASGVDPATRV
jgi:hypothetical protein